MQNPTGGFIENFADKFQSVARNPGLSLADIPAKIGKFTFRAPYNVTAYRLTDPSNAPKGVHPTGYPYWPAINAYESPDLIKIFLSRPDLGPMAITLDTISDSIADYTIFPTGDSRANYHAVGWFWSPVHENSIIITINDSRIQRYDVLTRKTEILFDVKSQPGHERHAVKQISMSRDGRVIGGSVMQTSGDWLVQGAFAYNLETKKFDFFKPVRGGYDEAQIDKTGEYLLIKENIDGKQGEDNRIIHLASGQERRILDPEGAAGHSDMHFGGMIAADNYAKNPGVWKAWDFTADKLAGKEVVRGLAWGKDAPSHISFNHARPGPLEKQFAVGSALNPDGVPLGNEIVAFSLDGSLRAMPICPSLSSVTIAGNSAHTSWPFANTCYRGRFVLWTPVINGRRDAFLALIPAEKLIPGYFDNEAGTAEPVRPPVAPPAPAPAPNPEPAEPPAPAPAPAPAAEPEPEPAPEPTAAEIIEAEGQALADSVKSFLARVGKARKVRGKHIAAAQQRMDQAFNLVKKSVIK